MFDLLYKDGRIEVMKDDVTIARMYPKGDYVLVKMLGNGFDFSVGNQSTALEIIKMRVER